MKPDELDYRDAYEESLSFYRQEILEYEYKTGQRFISKRPSTVGTLPKEKRIGKVSNRKNNRANER